MIEIRLIFRVSKVQLKSWLMPSKTSKNETQAKEKKF